MDVEKWILDSLARLFRKLLIFPNLCKKKKNLPKF